jgi:hypothetical protein
MDQDSLISYELYDSFQEYIDGLYYQGYSEELFANDPVRYYYELQIFVESYV